ncbi:MAG TPA: PhoH family protein [Candidatus Limnocylindria bacterium]|jgi:phosphate starvation-inducible PhoH-like protein
MAQAQQITILIPDPDEMMFVAGQNETNIDRIEREFGVKIVARGAELRISGEPSSVARVGDLVGAMRSLSGRDDNLRRPALERLIGDAKESPVATPQQLREHIATTITGKRIAPQSDNQRRYVEAMRAFDLVFATGVAGTGKSYLAVAMGVNALRERKVTRLILTRPAVEAGENLGFLPGDMAEKIDPYLRPLYDALYELMPAERMARAQERGEIEVAPLAFMRGRTLSEAFIILDEAQNTTPAQMKMFLTRLGYGSQAVVTGDITQVDLVDPQKSGMAVAREILHGVEGISFVDFDERDVVRHELVTRIVRAYDRHERSPE